MGIGGRPFFGDILFWAFLTKQIKYFFVSLSFLEIILHPGKKQSCEIQYQILIYRMFKMLFDAIVANSWSRKQISDKTIFSLKFSKFHRKLRNWKTVVRNGELCEDYVV